MLASSPECEDGEGCGPTRDHSHTRPADVLIAGVGWGGG